jgi:rhomboid protease GluP
LSVDRILLWLAVAGSLALLLQLGRSRAALGWFSVAMAVLTMAGLSSAFDVPGTYVGLVWLIFLMLPLLLMRVVMALVMQRRYQFARRLMLGLRLLHPMDGWWVQPRVLAALHAAETQDPTEGVATLERLCKDPRLSAKDAAELHHHALRLAGRWKELASNPPRTIEALATVAPTYLRALGETGRLADMMASFGVLHERIGLGQPLCQLIVLAFTGRRAAVDLLLTGLLAPLDADTKTLWRVTAALAAGGPAAEAALATLEAMRTSPDPAIRAASVRRLTRPLADPRVALPPGAWAQLDALEAELRHVGAMSPRGRPWVTLVLIGLNLVCYGLEIVAGGSQNLDVLYRLGALDPLSVLQGGEWWRIVAATFLHYGPLHLGMNMVALLVLGSDVERALGRWRTAAIYAVSGLLSMATILLLVAAGWMKPDLTVGASGAIFGLLGAQLAILAVGWRRLRSPASVGRLRALLLVIGLQVAFDLSTPEIASAAHAAGGVVGLLMTLLLAPRHAATSTRQARVRI